MYLIILSLISESTSFYLVPDEVVMPIKSSLDKLVLVTINVDSSEEDDKAYDTVEKEISKWNSYRIPKSSITSVNTNGTYVIEFAT